MPGTNRSNNYKPLKKQKSNKKKKGFADL